jgi:uncharacterized protein (DUF111 family)
LARELYKVDLGRVYDIETQKVLKNGISATAFNIYGAKSSDRIYIEELAHIIADSDISPEAKRYALMILKRYANAYTNVYETKPQDILLCGEKAIRTAVNIMSSALLLNMLGVEAVISSPITEGIGFAKTGRSMMRVPVPIVMEIMRLSGAPIEICQENTQLITPTGAAIVCACTRRFDKMPSMTISSVGFGAGLKELDGRANVLRAVLGRNEELYFEESLFTTDVQHQGEMRGFLTSCK